MTDLTLADVDDVKNYLLTTREDLLTWLPNPWQPAWRSEAADELRNAEAGPGGAWGENPVRTAYAAASTFVFAAVDCLDAMADSANLLTTLFVPHVLARAAMEAGAQAWWLLEPKIGARNRVIRSILIRASSARYLGEAARKLDPVPGSAANFGEDQNMVRTYAASLGLSYICNDDRVECEGEKLPSYNARANEFEKALFMTGAYKIYSGAAHAELYAVTQSWRPSTIAAPLWEKNPDRIAVWAAVLAGAGCATVPAFRAITLLGKNARMVDLAYSMRKIGQMTRRLGLPKEWVY